MKQLPLTSLPPRDPEHNVELWKKNTFARVGWDVYNWIGVMKLQHSKHFTQQLTQQTFVIKRKIRN